jgi:hypothetical protein
VRGYPSEFRVTGAAANDSITFRYLLSDPTGLEADYVPDFDWRADVVRLCVQSWATLSHLYPSGLVTNYRSGGIVVAAVRDANESRCQGEPPRAGETRRCALTTQL